MKKEWESHAKLGAMAFSALPRWEQDLLEDLPAAGEELLLLPECHNLKQQLGASCLIMDWVYDPTFRPYGLQPDGIPLPHMLPDSNGKGAFFSGNAPSPGKFAQILTDLMEKTLRAWERKEYTLFTRYGGVLGHFLQDTTAPTHTLTPAMRSALFPDPVPGRLKSVGPFCYSIADHLSVEQVTTCHASIPEAVFSLTHKAFAAADRARKVLKELLHGAYAEDLARCEELLKQPAADAAQLTAEAWHTILSLGCGKISPSAKPPFPLPGIMPLAHHPDQYASAPPGVYCKDGNYHAMNLLSGNTVIPCKNAIAMTGHSGMKFFVNNLFHTLEFTLGLAPFPESLDKRMALTFQVETAPEWDHTFSEDMEYGTKAVLSIPIDPAFRVRRYKVDIRGAVTLAFTCKAAPYRTEEGSIDFVIPHLGIEEALLY